MAHQTSNPARSKTSEVLLEFQVVGDYLRLAAIHADTGVEVVVMGPKTAQRHELQQIALAKLKRKLGLSDKAAPPDQVQRGKLV